MRPREPSPFQDGEEVRKDSEPCFRWHMSPMAHVLGPSTSDSRVPGAAFAAVGWIPRPQMRIMGFHGQLPVPPAALPMERELLRPGAVSPSRSGHSPLKVKAGQAPRARVGLREVLPALIVLMVAAWALFISAVFVLAAAVIPLEITGPRIIYVELQVAKGVAGAVILAAWIYSYLRLRDVVARFLLTPRQRASDRTPP